MAPPDMETRENNTTPQHPAMNTSDEKRNDTSVLDESISSTTDDGNYDNSEVQSTTKRKVTFGHIELREYCRVLGNNPATTHGPPLSLGWAYNKTGTFDVDAYEEARPPRRVTNQMMIPGSVRESILLDQAHVTKKQIQSMEQDVKAARHKRQLTVAMQEFESYHLAIEFVVRRLRRIRSGVSKKKEEELLWENAAMITGKPNGKRLKDYDNHSDDSSTVSDSGYIHVTPVRAC